MPTLDRTRFISRAQLFGAALLYAPQLKTDTLKNLGSIVLPDGVQKNGAELVVPGLVTDAAAEKLDGVNDFIATNWLTRVNLMKGPTGESLAFWGKGANTELTAPGALGAISGRKVFRMKRIAEGVGGVEAFSPNATVVAGATYTASAYRFAGATKISIRIDWKKTGVAISSTANVEQNAEGRAIVTGVAPAEANEGTIVVTSAGMAKEATVEYDAVLVETAAAVAAYFPTAAQLLSGESAWSGAENSTASFIGPFCEGGARTFMGFAKRTNNAALHCLLGGAAAKGPFLQIQNQVPPSTAHWSWSASIGPDLFWEGAKGWPLNETTYFWVLVVDTVGNKVTWYVNGIKQEQKASEGLFDAAAGELVVGCRGAATEPWPGSMLPFAGFLKALGDQEILEMFEYVTSTAAVKRELIPDQLAVRVEAPSGTTARWAEDEPLVRNVLSDIVFGDEIPGGYKEMAGTLARNPQIGYPDLAPYSDITVYGVGGEVLWQGSLDKGPGVSGDQVSIAPAALGYQFILEDNGAAKVGFLDRDLSKWGDESTQRKKELNAAGVKIGSSNVTSGLSDKGPEGPGITIAIENFDAAGIEWGEQVYYGDGVPLGELHGDFHGHGEDVNWEDVAGLGKDDILTGLAAAQTEDFNAKLEQIHWVIKAPDGFYRYAHVTTQYGNAGFVGTANIQHRWTNLLVRGRDGLALLGTWPAVGLSAKQMVEYLINNYAQPLFTEPEYIEDDGYVIPQAWYGEGQSLSNILNDLTKYGLLDWFVYTGKRLEYRRPQTYGRFWRAYVAPSNLQEVGIDSQRLWRSIVVRYTDANGTNRSVGPYGSAANTETTELEITDPEHPAVKANRTRRDILDMQGISTPAAAIAVGKRFLEEANLLNRSGSASLAGYIFDDKYVLRPVSQVKAGDWISFADSSDTSYRKIVSKQYTHASRSSDIEIDAPPAGMEALLERLQASLITAGVA